MKIPGYSAEASLYQTNRPYYMTAAGAHPDGAISPAQFAGPLSYWRCVRLRWGCWQTGTSPDGFPILECGLQTYFVC